MRLDLLSKNVKYRWRIKKMNLLFKFCFVKILEIKRQNKLFVYPEKKLFVFPEVPIEMRADGQLNQSIRSPSTGRKCPPDKSRRNNRSIKMFFLFFCFFGDAKCCYLLVLTTSRLLFNTPGLLQCWCCNYTDNLFDEYHFNENNVTNHNGKWTIDRKPFD